MNVLNDVALMLGWFVMGFVALMIIAGLVMALVEGVSWALSRPGKRGGVDQT